MLTSILDEIKNEKRHKTNKNELAYIAKPFKIMNTLISCRNKTNEQSEGGHFKMAAKT